MRPRFSLFLIAIALALATASSSQAQVVQKLLDISVTVKSGGSQGSGTLVTRKLPSGDTITFVWTAGHVVDGLRKTRTVVDPESGTPRAVVEFEDAQIVKEFTEDGRRIGEQKFEARILRYSDSEQGEDLALLQVRKKNYTTEGGTEFYLDAAIPPIGTDLYHVGSLLGQFGANSFTTGTMSQHGRVLNLGANGVIFDQTTVTAFPGSSGGGVFLKSDGRYVGMLVRGAGEQFNFIVPARRLAGWAKKAKVEWAIDPKVAVPTYDELDKIKPEDTGVSFNRADAKPKGYGFYLQTPKLPTLGESSP